MPVACVLIPHFRYRAEVKRNPGLAGSPLLIVRTENRVKVLSDFTPSIPKLSEDMPLSHAVTLTENPQIVEADEAYYQTVQGDLTRRLMDRVPDVEKGDLGCFYVDTDGMESMYRSDARLVTVLQSALPKEFAPQTGIGQNRFLSYLAANIAEPRSAFKVTAEAKEFAQVFTVDYLPVAPLIKSRLHRFGINTLKDISAIGIGPMQAQFGVTGGLMWELSQGIDSRPFNPLKQQETALESMTLPYPAVVIDMLLLGIESLLKKLFARKAMRGRYAGRATLECSAYARTPWQRTYVFKERLGSADKLLFAIKSRLLTDPPPIHVEDISLCLSDIKGEIGIQESLFGDVKAAREERIIELSRRLQEKMNGIPGLYRVASVDPEHPLPEMRTLQVPVNPEAAERVRPLNMPIPVDVREEEDGSLAVAASRNSGIEKASVEDTWQVDIWWGPKPTGRTYHSAVSSDGKVITLFHDNSTDKWYRQNA